jgi:hypothetical protein
MLVQSDRVMGGERSKSNDSRGILFVIIYCMDSVTVEVSRDLLASDPDTFLPPLIASSSLFEQK